MSKGLELLEDIKQLLSLNEYGGNKDKQVVNYELEVIEQELKEREDLLNSVKAAFNPYESTSTNIDDIGAYIQKKLVVLDIIKYKGIDTEIMSQFDTYAEYVEYYNNNDILKNLFTLYTEEEFNLINEVLYER